MRRISSRSWALAFAALLIGAVIVTPSDDDPAPIRIGVSLGLTGSYASITRPQERAYRLWEAHVNQHGGILGRPVQLIIRDDQSQPELGRKIYQDLIEREKVDLLFGPYSSAITAAVAPLTEKHGYSLLSAGAASDELWKRGYKRLFTVIPPGGRYPIGFLALLAEARVTRIAIVYADDTYAASVAEGAAKWAAEYGLTVTFFQKVAKGAPDLDPVTLAARQSGANALVMAGHYEEAVNMRRALKRIGWSPVYYASIGPGLDAYRDAVGADAAEGTFSSSLWEAREDLQLPGSVEFLRAYLHAYDERPSYQAALAYAAGEVMRQAVQRAGRLDRARVRRALSQLDTQLLVGRYLVDRTGFQVGRSPMIIQWQRGQREIVWPPELKTAVAVVRRSSLAREAE